MSFCGECGAMRLYSHFTAEGHRNEYTELETLRATIAAQAAVIAHVQALHYGRNGYGHPADVICNECGRPWPCRTSAAAPTGKEK